MFVPFCSSVIVGNGCFSIHACRLIYGLMTSIFQFLSMSLMICYGWFCLVDTSLISDAYKCIKVLLHLSILHAIDTRKKYWKISLYRLCCFQLRVRDVYIDEWNGTISSSSMLLHVWWWARSFSGWRPSQRTVSQELPANKNWFYIWSLGSHVKLNLHCISKQMVGLRVDALILRKCCC